MTLYAHHPNTGRLVAVSSAPVDFEPTECESALQFLASSHAEWARGAALFGPGGLFDAQRKKTLSAIECELRDEYKAKDEKATETRIEQEAHCATDYVTFLDTMEARRADWLLLDAQRDEAQLRLKVYTYTSQPMRAAV